MVKARVGYQRLLKGRQIKTEKGLGEQHRGCHLRHQLG